MEGSTGGFVWTGKKEWLRELLGLLALSVGLGASAQDAAKAEAGVTACGIVCPGLVVAVCGARRQLIQVVGVVWRCGMRTWCW